jgi:hypothetical protein
MAAKPISEEEFDRLLASFERSAFHLETRDVYALGYERADFELFLAGAPRPPSEVDWWRPWLDQMTRLVREGKQISRVRILAEPPTGYQQWMIWSTPWHAAAGEEIRYMPRSMAERVGLPLEHDWWLLDDERVIATWFTDGGEIHEKFLITDPASVGSYRLWRDVARRKAAPAEEIAAA